MLRPFFPYYGGKWRAAARYPAPTRRRIVEPFAGAAGYACRHADLDVLLVELDPIVAAVWRWLLTVDPADVLAIGDIPDGATVDDLDAPQAARWLAGFWCNPGSAWPGRRPSAWIRNGTCGGPVWGWSARTRQRIAAQVPMIRHWRIIEGDYTEAPDIDATWYIDPPYQTAPGRCYRCSDIDHDSLGRWARSRRGQVIACDQVGATWMPWTGSLTLKAARGASSEVVYHRDDLSLL